MIAQNLPVAGMPVTVAVSDKESSKAMTNSLTQGKVAVALRLGSAMGDNVTIHKNSLEQCGIAT